MAPAKVPSIVVATSSPLTHGRPTRALSVQLTTRAPCMELRSPLRCRRGLRGLATRVPMTRCPLLAYSERRRGRCNQRGISLSPRSPHFRSPLFALFAPNTTPSQATSVSSLGMTVGARQCGSPPSPSAGTHTSPSTHTSVAKSARGRITLAARVETEGLGGSKRPSPPSCESRGQSRFFASTLSSQF
ncbi:hypothetical protein BDW22DRAFT_574674 [Trametopsis cervina]|nr:hypothetical protein BDW22DRAFT_574674 [Trametopsis cervina]